MIAISSSSSPSIWDAISGGNVAICSSVPPMLFMIPYCSVVRVLAGHADLQTTMRYYAQADSEQMAKAAAAIDALLSKTDARMTPNTGFDQ